MNPIIFALRHPITVMVAIVAIVGGSVLAFTRMKISSLTDGQAVAVSHSP
jgi:hypothetical protein